MKSPLFGEDSHLYFFIHFPPHGKQGQIIICIQIVHFQVHSSAATAGYLKMQNRFPPVTTAIDYFCFSPEYPLSVGTIPIPEPYPKAADRQLPSIYHPDAARKLPPFFHAVTVAERFYGKVFPEIKGQEKRGHKIATRLLLPFLPVQSLLWGWLLSRCKGSLLWP